MRSAGAVAAESTDQGLSLSEAARLLAQHGPNELVPERTSGWIRKILRPFLEPMALVLIAVGVLYLFLGDVKEAVVILAAVVPIVGIDLVLDLRMERTLSALKQMTRPTARVFRAGLVRVVPTREVVPGDVLLVEEGELLPADAILFEGSDVLADESSLTGESENVSKEPGAAIFAGTSIVLGRGRARVVATGPRTRYGKIGVLVAGIDAPRTPLQQKLDRLVRLLAALALVTCLGVVAIELWRGVALIPSILSGAALALSAIAEEFPIVFTLFLSLGAFRMARHKALIRRWAGVETLGSATVICCDKTGTLTEGRLHLARLWTPDGGEGSVALAAHEHAPAELLRNAVLASEPEPYDPLEKAIYDGCGRVAHLKPHAFTKPQSLVKEHSFVRTTFRMSHIWRDAEGRLLLAMKGSVEGVLQACELTAEERERADSAHRALAAQGMKVLAVASRQLESLAGTREQDEVALHLDGLVAFADPPRAGVATALQRCREAGIRVVMITGDHPATAHAIAEQIHLPHEDAMIVTGEDIARLSDGDLDRTVGRLSIVARATPDQKHRIVKSLKRTGEVVAMTGDGINDAPALKEADIGVAMGLRGTEVARAAATMVLLDDSFPTIVVAVEEGRRIYDNIRKAFRYLISFKLPIVMAALVAPLLGWPLLLLPLVIVWLELIVHPISALAFEAEPAEPDVMKRSPRRRDAPLLTLREVLTAGSLALTVTAAVLGLYAWSLGTGATEEHARGAALAVLVLAQIGLVLTWRSPARGLAGGMWSRNKTLSLSCLGVAASVALVFGVPWLRELLHVELPHPREWLWIGGLTIASTLWPEAFKRQPPEANATVASPSPADP